MAPRGRHRKVGLKRMDAAIDSLTPMGFSPNIIRQTVKDLLKVYDGDEGWVFIEEASYKLLIESILEGQEAGQPQQGEPSLRDSPNEMRVHGSIETDPSEVGPSVHEPCLFPPGETQISPSKNVEVEKHPEVNRTVEIIRAQEFAALIDACMVSAPPGFEYMPLPRGFPTRKRKPCLGWVGPKDDDDFVLLSPAPIRGWKVDERRRRRKSRWDVGPNDFL